LNIYGGIVRGVGLLFDWTVENHQIFSLNEEGKGKEEKI